MSNIDKHTVQAVADLKAGYTLGHADVAILNELARIALASLEAEPVAWTTGRYSQNIGCSFGDKVHDEAPCIMSLYWDLDTFRAHTDCDATALRWLEGAIKNTGAKPLYTAPPAPVFRRDLEEIIFTIVNAMADEKLRNDESELFSLAKKYIEHAKSKLGAALQGENADTTAIPNGWKLVPIDPTKDMLRAGQSVVGFWLNTVHCYSKMLAAAPAAPQQEAE